MKKHVFDAFLECAEADNGLVLGSVSPGSLPFIHAFVPKEYRRSNRDGAAPWGSITMRDRLNVFINDKLFRRAERRARLEDDDDEYLPLFERTVLHEIVHWGAYRDGIREHPAKGPIEEGSELEKEALGYVTSWQKSWVEQALKEPMFP